MKVKQELQNIKNELDNIIVSIESVNQTDSEIKKMLIELKETKEKYDAGKISKFALLKTIDSDKEKLAKLSERKKVISKKMLEEAKTTNDLLKKIKDIYSLRVKMDGIGKIK